ncbi:CENP-B homolog protein 2-like [Rhizophagus clarus]|uniref:CENP-B homolog protein 2-like n=1 Tax=Rhizophagus clarus TaxID=94130 RepID=A0A8H3L571_9GLOM|nr:CENP-B homolog protein 2-like [Rhizophagus clarus]
MCLELELALKEFVLRYQHQIILSDAILIEKAKLLASELEILKDTLQFSSGWLQGFKKRNKNHQEKLHGEAASSDQTAIDEALPLLQWLQEFDYQVAQKYGGQRVLLLLDNCSSHKLQGLVLPHVEVYFLPPNTTSKIQLMDSGIIMSFKRHYRYFHIHWILEQVEAGWNNITAETIYNCWHHTKILPIDTNVDPDFSLDDRDVSDELTNALNALNFLDMMELEEYLTISEENIVSEIHDNDEIIAEIVNNFKKKSNENNTDNDLDEVDDSIKEEVISFNIALKSLKKVNTFLLQQENAYKELKLVNLLEKFVKKK